MPRVIAITVVLAVLASGCGSATLKHPSANTPITQTARGRLAMLKQPSAKTPLTQPASRGLCPASDAAPRVFLGTAGSVLVPGRPTTAVLCHYWGETEGQHSAHTLAGAVRIVRQDVTTYLASELDDLQPISPHANCDEVLDGRSDLILFRYHSAGEARVRITRAGCIPVTNGRIVRGALGALAHRGDGEVHWPDEDLL